MLAYWNLLIENWSIFPRVSNPLRSTLHLRIRNSWPGKMELERGVGFLFCCFFFFYVNVNISYCHTMYRLFCSLFNKHHFFPSFLPKVQGQKLDPVKNYTLNDTQNIQVKSASDIFTYVGLCDSTAVSELGLLHKGECVAVSINDRLGH